MRGAPQPQEAASLSGSSRQTRAAASRTAPGRSNRPAARYFATKDDVLTEPAREMAAEVAAAIASAPQDMPEPLVLRQALTEIASYALTHRVRLRQLTAVIKSSPRSSPLTRLSEQEQQLARQLADRRGGGSSGPDWRTRLLVARAVAGLRVWLDDILGETADPWRHLQEIFDTEPLLAAGEGTTRPVRYKGP